uniref:NAD(P)/FAD-dependent oxidoreductase n=1 Tax=Desertifilum tharense IPPAS B-1220 TaxID=1781255 RepID=A0ACD5H2V6_9CYAN
MSGGGRCNVTHACFDPAVLVQNYPRGGKALRGSFSRFQPRDTVKWFEDRGVKLKTEEDDRMFPVTDRSETIVECLIEEAIAAGVDIRTGISVQGIQHKLVDDKPRFEVRLKSGQIILGDRILLATGSNPLGYQIARSLGHTIIPPFLPYLPLTLPIRACKTYPELQSTTREFASTTPNSNKPVPVLITHWGLSGTGGLETFRLGR